MRMFSRKKIMVLVAVSVCLTMLFTVTALSATNYSQCWDSGQGGTVTYQNLSGGHYKVNWSNINNFVAGKGYNPSGSRVMTWSGYASGAQYFGVYGWLTGPLVEYYIGRGGGTYVGTYPVNGRGNYTLYKTTVTGPSIQGYTTFTQYNCSGSGSSGVDLAQHFAGWRSLGQSVGGTNYCIVATEGWGGSSGSADVTVN